MTTLEVQESEGMDSVSLFSEDAILSKTEPYKLLLKDKTSKSSLLYASAITEKSSITES